MHDVKQRQAVPTSMVTHGGVEYTGVGVVARALVRAVDVAAILKANQS